MSLFQADSVRRGGMSALLYASERDHRHRPASHSLLRARVVESPEPPEQPDAKREPRGAGE